MEIRGKTALVLGGAGLVGQAICRELINEGVSKLVVSSLFEEEANSFIDQLRSEFGPKCPELVSHWGNVFVRNELKDVSRVDLLNSQNTRKVLLGDLLEPLNKEILNSSGLYHVLTKHNPNIVVDAINTATAVSYQNVFGAAKESLSTIENIYNEKIMTDEDKATLEKLLLTQYVPQLIRHIQLLLQSMNEIEVEIYLKIGTCGTGGMGLNIPYTHSEDKPSQMLLAKSAVAGAHSLLLFLMGRTPGGPVIKELKPAAAIAWKRVAYGSIKKRGQEILLEKVNFDDETEIEKRFNKQPAIKTEYIIENGKPKSLQAPFIDTGENGMFARGEFETITDEGQMEFITPEEIAQASVWEIRGRNTGFDIVAALDNSTMGPTYRAGFMRQAAISELNKLEDECGIQSVAFELLGPPRLSKLLYEAHLLRMAYGDFKSVLDSTPKEISEKVTSLLSSDPELLSRIISISIPVLKSNKKLIRGKHVSVPADIPGKPNAEFEASQDLIDKWAHDGWVDLRYSNFELWKNRISFILENINSISVNDTSSNNVYRFEYWKKEKGTYKLHESKLVSWIFIHEDKGVRMKA